MRGAILCTLLHEKLVKMPRYRGALNAPESSFFYGIKIEGSVDIAGRSKTRPKSICTLQSSSQYRGAIRFRLSQQKIRMSLFAISQGTSSAVAAVAVESVAARGQDRGATRKRSLGVPAPRGPSRGDGALRWWGGGLRWRCPEVVRATLKAHDRKMLQAKSPP